MSYKFYNIHSVFSNIPPEINRMIHSFLYDNKESMAEYKKIWEVKNKKQVVLMDMINIPNDMICYNYLTIKNYNEFPCWYCQGMHALRICTLYMRDMSRVYKLYDTIQYK